MMQCFYPISDKHVWDLSHKLLIILTLIFTLPSGIFQGYRYSTNTCKSSLPASDLCSTEVVLFYCDLLSSLRYSPGIVQLS